MQSSDFSGDIRFCSYKKEQYSVRDNGEVLRHPQEGKRLRPLDNQWTYGKINKLTGYLDIGSERVHRIVAFAFLGEPPTKEHVVDHIDTNRQNNRPENLRWVTKLENVLLNPITAKRIELVCGSVETFLENPSKYRDMFPEPHISWMCSVSKEEAQISLENFLKWAKSDKKASGGTLGNWIYQRANPEIQQEMEVIVVPDTFMSNTHNAKQRKWKIPSEFPCCPVVVDEHPLRTYAEQLKTGAVFCTNNTYTSLVLKIGFSPDKQSLYVKTESSSKDSLKRWALAKITVEEEVFVHTNIQNFFTEIGAEKQFCIAQGLEWSGGDSIDDYC